MTLGGVVRHLAGVVFFTAHDLAGFRIAATLAHPSAGMIRRARLRPQLDAAFFHLYGLNRADTEYVLNTFEVLRTS